MGGLNVIWQSQEKLGQKELDMVITNQMGLPEALVKAISVRATVSNNTATQCKADTAYCPPLERIRRGCH